MLKSLEDTGAFNATLPRISAPCWRVLDVASQGRVIVQCHSREHLVALARAVDTSPVLVTVGRNQNAEVSEHGWRTLNRYKASLRHANAAILRCPTSSSAPWTKHLNAGSAFRPQPCTLGFLSPQSMNSLLYIVFTCWLPKILASPEF